jgi:hypothetical protein
VQDLTLPLISLFTGAGFNKIVKESFEHGAGRIEDLWLKCAFTQLQNIAWLYPCSSVSSVSVRCGLSQSLLWLA